MSCCELKTSKRHLVKTRLQAVIKKHNKRPNDRFGLKENFSKLHENPIIFVSLLNNKKVKMDYDINKKKAGQPLVSFVIFFEDDDAGKLQKCVDSVLRLSLRQEEREVFVIGDGTREPLVLLLNGSEDEVVVVRQPSSGINSAMNLGMRMATGRYVQFLSAADTLLLDGYGHCLDMMRYEKPEIIVFESSRDEKQRTSYEDGKMESGTEFMRHNTINPSPAGYAFRKNLTEGMTFDTANESSDEEFTVLLFLKAEKVLPTTAVARFKGKDRQTAGGDDKKTVIKKLEDQYAMICRLHDMAYAMPVDDRLAIERRVAQMTMSYILAVVKDLRSAKQLRTRIEQLEEKGLFPLPDKRYNKKYTIFSKLVKRKLVRDLALKLLE